MSHTADLRTSTSPNFADPRSAISNYMQKIDDLAEVDYGDFKRKVGQYLLRIEELLAARGRGEPLSIIQEVRQKVVYYPQFDIDDGREYTLDRLRKILSLL